MKNRVEPAQTNARLPGALHTVAVSEEKMSEQDLLYICLAICAGFANTTNIETAVSKHFKGSCHVIYNVNSSADPE